MRWAERSACVGTAPTSPHDPDLWFSAEDTDQTAAAIRICRGCLVRLDCLTYALGRVDLDGVWGGMTASERRRMQRSPGCNVAQVERVGGWREVRPHGTEAAMRRHHRAGEPLCDRCSRAKEYLDAERRGSRRVA